MASHLGCSIGSLPSSYLGFPLGASSRSQANWEPVIERFRKRLAGWKARYLSKGGREVLVKSTLSSIPIYLMSLLSFPMSVVNVLDRILRYSFLG